MKFKSFVFGLMLVGLVAALYASPKTLFLKIVFRETAGPYNTLWNGTSDLATMLRSQGYRVASPITYGELSDIVGAGGYERLIYVVVSPDYPLDPEGSDRWLVSLLERDHANISVLIADEDTTSNPLLSRYGLGIAGKALFYGEDNPFPRATFMLPGVCVRSPAGPMVPANYTVHVVWLDWASYFDRVSEDACVVGTAVAFEEGSQAYRRYVVGVYLDHGVNRGIGAGNSILAISDGSVFINSAMRSGRADYGDLASNVFGLLSMGSRPQDTLVVLDAIHYRKQQVVDENGYPAASVPLPLVFHPAMLVVVALSMWRTAESWFYGYLASQPLAGFPVALVSSLLIYGYLRRQAGVRETDDTVVRRVEEVEVLAETPVRARYAGLRRISKRDALRIASDLYELLDSILRKSLGIGMSDLLGEPGAMKYLAEATGMPVDEVEKIVRRLALLRERAEGKRRFTPLVLSWTRTTRRLVGDVEKVLEGLGYTLLSKSEKYRRLEYGVRGLF